MRPVFRDLLFASVAAQEAGLELIGMTVQMDLPELGLTGEAIVTDIQPCPKIEPRAGASDDRRVVTATFHHSSGDVIDLVLANESSRHTPCDEAQRDQTAEITKPGRHESAPQNASGAASSVTTQPVVQQHSQSAMPHHSESDGDFADSIGTTSNHPFWSVDRQEYVQAGQLRVGERLQTLHGDTKTVVSNLPRPGPKTNVYNLEVHAEHTYFVGKDGVLVHNAGPQYSGRGAFGRDPAPNSAARRAHLNQKFGRTGNLDADINARGTGAMPSRSVGMFTPTLDLRLTLLSQGTSFPEV